MNQFAGQDQRYRTETTEQNCGHGAEGRRGSSTDIYTLPCVNSELAGSCLQHREPNLALCDDLEGRDCGQREAREGERETERHRETQRRYAYLELSHDVYSRN